MVIPWRLYQGVTWTVLVYQEAPWGQGTMKTTQQGVCAKGAGDLTMVACLAATLSRLLRLGAAVAIHVWPEGLHEHLGVAADFRCRTSGSHS